LVLGLALLVPQGALAQTEEGDETTPSEEGEAGSSDGDAASGDAAETTEEGTEPTDEEAAPEPEPEPEVSATEPEVEAEASVEDAATAETAAELGVTDDVEDDTADADEEEEDGPKLAWRNSTFLWDNSISTATFDGSAGQTYNPTYEMAFSVRPRWYLNDDVSVRGRQDFSYELTDTDSRPFNRELVVADTRFDIVHSNVYEYEEAVLSLSGRLYLPTSKASRGYGLIFRPGVGVGVTRPFDVLEGLNLGLSSTYSYRVATRNVVLARENYPQRTASAGLDRDNPTDAQVPGLSRVDHEGTIGLTADVSPLENLVVGTSFTWWWNHGAPLADACLDTMDTLISASGDELCIEDESETHTRLLTWFTLSAGYQITDWINAEVGYSHLTSEFNPYGTRRNPLWSIDSLVSLTATVTLDKLYMQFTEAEVEAQVDADDSERRQTASARRARRAQ
jgi:hypothetical protein